MVGRAGAGGVAGKPIAHARSAPNSPTTLAGALDVLRRDPESLVYVLVRGEEDTELTAGALLDLAARWAQGLREAGIRPGEPVVIAWPTGPDFLGAFWGTVAIGAVPVPVPSVRAKRRISGDRPDVLVERVRGISKVLGSVAALVSPGTAEVLASADLQLVAPVTDCHDMEVTPAVDPEATVVIQFTSGSTAAPRGCQLSSRAIRTNMSSLATQLGVTGATSSINWAPLYHDMALMGGVVLPVLDRRFTGILMQPEDFLFAPGRWIDAVERRRAGHAGMPSLALPALARALVARAGQGVDLSCLRSLVVGAETVNPRAVRAVIDGLKACGSDERAVHVAYGLAETVLIASSRRGGFGSTTVSRRHLAENDRVALPADGEEGDRTEVTSVGHAVPGTSIRVTDELRRPVDDGRVGRIELQSRSLLTSYVGMSPEASGFADGWYLTGDLGFVEGGELFVLGRTDDVLVVGGQNHYAPDLEHELAALNGVHQGAVAAFTFDNGERRALAIAFETRASDRRPIEQEIAATCSRQIGSPPALLIGLRPGLIPRTSSGKVRRRELEQRHARGELGEVADPC
ncbi:MAG: AMP-binding protein [Ilumatobacteraceae bacterium]